MEQSAGFAVYGGDRVNTTDIMRVVMASRSDTPVAYAFRKALGIERLHPQPAQKRKRKRHGRKYVNYAKLMDNRYGSTERHGKYRQ